MTEREGSKEELLDQLTYLKLITYLVRPEEAHDEELRNLIPQILAILESISHDDLQRDEGALRIRLKPYMDKNLSAFPLKRPLVEAAREIRRKFSEDSGLLSYGLEFGWLDQLIDISGLNFPSDMPAHTRVGIGAHAGYANIDEDFLLRDAFYLLVKGRNFYEQLKSLSKSNSSSIVDQASYKRAELLNENVCTFSRLAVLSFFAFTEAFVNGVGYDYSIFGMSLF